jgi:hypothetical protein
MTDLYHFLDPSDNRFIRSQSGDYDKKGSFLCHQLGEDPTFDLA